MGFPGTALMNSANTHGYGQSQQHHPGCTKDLLPSTLNIVLLIFIRSRGNKLKNQHLCSEHNGQQFCIYTNVTIYRLVPLQTVSPFLREESPQPDLLTLCKDFLTLITWFLNFISWKCIKKRIWFTGLNHGLTHLQVNGFLHKKDELESLKTEFGLPFPA